MVRLACTGFVSEEAGSVAAANAILLRQLLEANLTIDFFSKPSFVDPRPAVGDRRGFRFIPVVNSRSDSIRRHLERKPVVGSLACRNDAACYNRLLGKRLNEEHHERRYDAVLWLGDYAHGAVSDVPTVSFAQGAPGTDARSVLRRRGEIRRLAGWREACKWELLARLRLSRLGRPSLRHSDYIIVGSNISRARLTGSYGVEPARISTLPYPIDLQLFCPQNGEPSLRPASLRLLWLGRIVPRKRLDLFLDGLAFAIRHGVDLTATIVGATGFIPGYEKLIQAFPFPERLTWIKTIPRTDVPALLLRHDVLVQPSEEENFGSSVAEAQACGLPVIVGRTNGNGDYLCERDWRLADEQPSTLASAIEEYVARRGGHRWGDPRTSRALSEKSFEVRRVSDHLISILESVIGRASSGGGQRR